MERSTVPSLRTSAPLSLDLAAVPSRMQEPVSREEEELASARGVLPVMRRDYDPMNGNLLHMYLSNNIQRGVVSCHL